MYVSEQTRPYILANSELYTPKVLPPLLLHDGILCGFKILSLYVSLLWII